MGAGFAAQRPAQRGVEAEGGVVADAWKAAMLQIMMATTRTQMHHHQLVAAMCHLTQHTNAQTSVSTITPLEAVGRSMAGLVGAGEHHTTRTTSYNAHILALEVQQQTPMLPRVML